jgi:hypothetical protein
MPARGDGITKRKDGRYMARYTVYTPDGPKRKPIYSRKYKEIGKKYNEARANANKGLVFDANNLKLAEWLDSWLDDLLRPLVGAGKMAHSTYVRYSGIINNQLKPRSGTASSGTLPARRAAGSTTRRAMRSPPDRSITSTSPFKRRSPRRCVTT